MRIALEAAEIKALAAELAIQVNQTLIKRVDDLEVKLLKLLGDGGTQGHTRGQVIALDNTFLSTADVTALLNVSRSTLHRMVKNGKFPASIKISDSRVGWRQADVLAWVAKRQAA